MDEETNIPEIELIIKASTIDGRRKGACLFCQVFSTSFLPNYGPHNRFFFLGAFPDLTQPKLFSPSSESTG